MGNEYVKIKTKHPFADKEGFVFEHRLVVEKKIGRYLRPEEVIHHLNEIKSDNRIENLMLFRNQRAHMKFHTKLRQFGWTEPLRRQVRERFNGYA